MGSQSCGDMEEKAEGLEAVDWTSLKEVNVPGLFSVAE